MKKKTKLTRIFFNKTFNVKKGYFKQNPMKNGE